MAVSYPTVRFGQKNKAVLALQNGLHRALAAKGIKHENLRNQAFGSKTRDDLLRFRRAYMTPTGPISGKLAGSLVFQALAKGGFIGAYDQGLIRQHNRAVAAARAKAAADKKAAAASNSVSARRARVRASALRLYAVRAHYTYRQYRPMPSSAFIPDAYRKLDCSSSATLIFKDAGEPDPNGRGYDGQGYTGTLINRGRWSSNLVGTLAYYGDQGSGVPKHVTVNIGSGTAFSFGSTPMRLVATAYRGDYRGQKDLIG